MLLGVNIDHIATIRQARTTHYPDPVHAAFIAEQAGADSITVHLREDRRHIQERDIHLLRQTMRTPMNLEMANTKKMLAFAEDIKPQFCCLVPEGREELTTESGLDIIKNINQTAFACERLKNKGIRVSLFIDSEEQQIHAAKEVGADAIELHTGDFANAHPDKDFINELEKIKQGIAIAKSLGLIINAGHGLNYHNINHIARLADINELNIGHSIIARALFTGLDVAVREMKHLIQTAK